MKTCKKLAAAVSVFLLSATSVVSAWAASPPFARSDEEWEVLKDNKIEYSELADLIHEYNTTVRNNQYAYQDYLGKDRIDVEQDYRDLADELYSSMSGEDDMQSMITDLNLEIQARQMSQQADENVDDGQIVLMGYQQAEDSLVVSAQSNMINYFKKLQDLKLAEKNIELQEALYQNALAQYSAGTATQLEVLDAKETVLKAKQAAENTKNEITSLKQRLCVMLGWNYDAEPEICQIPDVNPEEIAAMNPSSDLERALEANYTLLINKRKMENSRTEEKRKDFAATISGNEQTIGSSLTSAYQAVTTADAAYNQAVSDFSLAQQNMQQTLAQYKLGMVTPVQLLSQEYALSASETALYTAKLSLKEAVETYKWSVNGLANAG